MNRDQAVPYILAHAFLKWWKDMGQPELEPAFHYWADRENLKARRRHTVWRRVEELQANRRAA
ncbi:MULTISPECIES: hypothetical protein [Deferrisoma]|nr:MAG: hypothetical protein D6708_10075 [Candidatus Dadabacteria bacterium]